MTNGLFAQSGSSMHELIDAAATHDVEMAQSERAVPVQQPNQLSAALYMHMPSVQETERAVRRGVCG